MDFKTSIRTCFKKITDFTGRASRSEYWWFSLFYFICNVFFSTLDIIFGLSGVANFQFLVVLIFCLPCLTVGVRRMHDVGRSGWWLLLSLTIIGIIPVLYWMIRKSDTTSNIYGEVPAHLQSA